MAAMLLGDGHAAWHLTTSAEAVDRGLVMGFSEWYCSPMSGNRSQHWSPSPIRDPRPRHSLQGAMQHDQLTIAEKHRGHVPPTTGLRGAGVRLMKVLR